VNFKTLDKTSSLCCNQ